MFSNRMRPRRHSFRFATRWIAWPASSAAVAIFTVLIASPTVPGAPVATAPTEAPAAVQAPGAEAIHHNIAGATINNGHPTSATVPIRGRTQALGAAWVYSLNESCGGQALNLLLWLNDNLAYNYSSVMFVQVANVPDCIAGSGMAEYGATLLTIGEGHASSASTFRYANQAGETRGAACMATGPTGAREAWACTTHLEGGGGLVKVAQWGQYYDIVTFYRGGFQPPCSSNRVVYAGDLYLTTSEIIEIERTRGVDWARWNIDADPFQRETTYGDGRQIDHVMANEYMTRLAPASLTPGDGIAYPNLNFLSDHRLVVSFIDTDTNPCGRSSTT